jgi:hypothetical protein
MMSLSEAWDWYAKPENREALKPFLTLFGSLIVGVGTIIVGALVARAALRQARTSTEQAKIATEVARIANRQAEIAAVRHEEQTRSDRQRRITDTFSKAVEQLASEKVEVRLGGIYTLERLAGEAPVNRRAAERPPDAGADAVSELYWSVMETLTAFVRERARWKEPDAAPEMPAKSDPSDETQPRPQPAMDIAAVLQVLRRRPAAGREHETRQNLRLDLRMTDLRGANLARAHLEGADLSGAQLKDANLSEAHLEGADLSVAQLEGANLVEAHLEGADLLRTHLEGASLLRAHLEGASLAWAHLEYAGLHAAHLEGARALHQEQIEQASGDAETRLPAGLSHPAHWLKPAGRTPAA